MNERFALDTPISLENQIDIDIESVVNLGEYETLEISGVTVLNNSNKGYLCFCDRDPGAKLASLAEGAVVLSNSELASKWSSQYPNAIWVVVRDPRATFIDLAMKFLKEGQIQVSDRVPRPFGVHNSVIVGQHTTIHPTARIDEGVVIGNHCVIHRGTWIKANTVIRDHVVIGSEGINAYRGLDGRQRGFPHLASVIIGNNTEIGASSVIPRGILNSTYIGDDVVIGNLCNIGHGASVADGVWMSVGCLIGGHTIIGRKTTIGMGVTVKDNLEIGDEAQVGMGSVVVRNVESGTSVFGNPARSTGNQIKAGPER
jgi:UDP-3-O-[3-hydroxymyristoyl] glucosamine N-acyltransferase